MPKFICDDGLTRDLKPGTFFTEKICSDLYMVGKTGVFFSGHPEDTPEQYKPFRVFEETDMPDPVDPPVDITQFTDWTMLVLQYPDEPLPVVRKVRYSSVFNSLVLDDFNLTDVPCDVKIIGKVEPISSDNIL